ncbi:hypothetical protein G7Y89_g8259 [Cudoniella acicularis]|uniref:Long-chain-alcohol oxidase n=1 Tax=Cudoniella acicularis TaxID=354080 RepID=A0A8H4RGW4_9HELO|nr:hypothetical protein G7Y89_g8259 [Cudoniella acicularis]
MASDLATLAPSPVSLPGTLSREPFTESQWTTLMAIMDTTIQSIRKESSADGGISSLAIPDSDYDATIKELKEAMPCQPDTASLEEYFDEKVSDNPQFQVLLKRTFVDSLPEKSRKGLAVVLSTLNHYKPGSPFKYDFIQFADGLEPEIIETDVVIVGSGCGGAVCAKNLAEAGNRVFVVEKAYHFEPTQLPMSEQVALANMFEAGGAMASDDGSISVVAGSTWGGGGTINWSASLQTQGFVRKEWAQDRGLQFFETAEFQSCLDRVCHRMGVSSEKVRHNHRNEILLEGSRKLGYHGKAVPQNSGGDEHYCGHCTLGCSSGQKQGPVISWLPDAARAGAKFVEGFQVDRVLFDESNSTKAIGVQGTWASRNNKGGIDGPTSERTVRQVIVKAKKVILSAGTLWSPIILKNSGLKNWQIGRNLYLHPVNLLASVFQEDIRPWEGGILTTVCSTFENLDGKGHGTKLEAVSMVPSMFMLFVNWTSGLEYKKVALKYRRMNGYISIARDRDTGIVYPDPDSGRPRIRYTPSAFDRAHCLEGVIALAKIAYVTGATEIHPCIQGVKPFIRDSDTPPFSTSDDPDLGVTDPRFKAWIKDLQQNGNKPPIGTFTSAHQMGTCRMSAEEKDGVVDSKGRVWGTEGLYVSDASIFPSASGVNPMITNMAISDWISRNIAKELRGGGASVESRL